MIDDIKSYDRICIRGGICSHDPPSPSIDCIGRKGGTENK